MRGLGRTWAIAIALSLALPAAASAAFAGSTILVSRPSGLGPVPPAFDGYSSTPGGVSKDGRYAAFQSSAEGFAPGTNPLVYRYIYLRDTQAGTTTLVSRSDGFNGVSANANSSNPVVAVAPVGAMPTAPTNVAHVLVAFTTTATNLFDDATHGIPNTTSNIGPVLELWLRDVTAGTTTLVSRANGISGAPDNNTVEGSYAIDVAPGGPALVYRGDGSVYGTGQAGGIFLRTVNAGATELVSCANDDCSSSPTVGGGDYDPTIRYVTGSPGVLRIAYATNDKSITGDLSGHNQIELAQANAPATHSSAAGQATSVGIESITDANSAVEGNSNSGRPSFSSDGNAVAFLSTSSNLTGDSGIPPGSEQAFMRDFTSLHTVLLSRAGGSSGAPANASVDTIALGGPETALRAVFSTAATSLVTIPQAAEHVYVRDLAPAPPTTSLVDRTSGANGSIGSAGYSPTVSQNGSAALFTGNPTILDAGGGTRFDRVYERSLPSSAAGSGSLTLVSRPNGTGPFEALTGDSSFAGNVVSADGRYVAFYSNSRSLSSVANPNFDNVYVRDLLTNRTILVSRASGATGAPGNGDSGFDNGGISADGRRVAFESDASNLVPGVPHGVTETYVRDLATNKTTLVSRASGASGADAAASAYPYAISAKGNAVVIDSDSPLDPAGAGGKEHLYVRNLVNNTTTLVDRDNGAAGTPASSSPGSAAIDADGGRVAFATTASLAGAPADNHDHVYVRDLHAATTTLVSRADGPSGASADSDAGHPSIDARGDAIAFDSSASNLGAGSGVYGVYLRKLTTGHTLFVSQGTTASGPIFDAGQASIDAAGDRVVFSATVTPNFGAQQEVYLRDLRAGTTVLVSRANGANGAPANGFVDAVLSPNGNCVAFVATSTNLGDGFVSGHFSAVHMRVVRGECPINPPRVTITHGPHKTKDRTPTFSFRANERKVKFACRVDHGRFKPCTSPHTTRKLSLGHHTFAVRATDKAGYTGPTTTWRFTIKRR